MSSSLLMMNSQPVAKHSVCTVASLLSGLNIIDQSRTVSDQYQIGDRNQLVHSFDVI